jgi:hypothetical protein
MWSDYGRFPGFEVVFYPDSNLIYTSKTFPAAPSSLSSKPVKHAPQP